jgi:hypothetical protein
VWEAALLPSDQSAEKTALRRFAIKQIREIGAVHRPLPLTIVLAFISVRANVVKVEG